MADVDQKSEGKACEAVLRVLETELGSTRGLVRRPEAEPECPRDRRVDYFVDMGSVELIIEHTRVEAHSSQIIDGIDFLKFTTDIASNLEGRLPRDASYNLLICDGALRGLKKIDKVRSALTEWVAAMAPKLAAPPHSAITPADVGVEATLCRVVAPWRRGRILAKRLAPPSLEDLRLLRLRKSVADKLPKLARWDGDRRALVLVLEDSDISISNSDLIADAYMSAASEAERAPNYVFLIETATPDWAVFTLVANGAPNRRYNATFREFPRAIWSRLVADDHRAACAWSAITARFQ